MTQAQEKTHSEFEQVLMARQPIYDERIKVVAYELLFRQYSNEHANVIDGDHATSELLVNAFTQLNLEDLIEGKKAFINFTGNLVKAPPPFDKGRLVIELLEDVAITDQLVTDLTLLAEQGYTIALDDYIHSEDAHRILPLASIVKIDVLQLSESELREHVALLAPYGITLLAEKVETFEMYELCRSLGFKLFQGYFLSKPQIITGKKVPASKLLVLELLSRLQAPETTMVELENLISRDPALGFKTLKLVNSAAYAPAQKIESLSRAITYLGLDTLRSLASLLVLSNLSDKPSALKDQSAVRARLCQAIGAKLNPQEAPMYFSIGLLSTLDAYFDQSLDSLLGNLPLDERIIGALTAHQGSYGQVLKTVIQLQQADLQGIDWLFLEQAGITPNALNDMHREAIAWNQSSLV